MKEANCFLCGGKFKRKKSQLDYSERNFCSMRCYRIYQEKFQCIDRECLYCGKVEKTRKCEGRNRFCSRGCWNEYRKAENKKAYIDKDGYWCVIKEGKNGRRQNIRVHTLIAERVLGRELKRSELVHHVNMITTDNRHKNLLICNSGYHRWLHSEMARRYAINNLEVGRVGVI